MSGQKDPEEQPRRIHTVNLAVSFSAKANIMKHL